MSIASVYCKCLLQVSVVSAYCKCRLRVSIVGVCCKRLLCLLHVIEKKCNKNHKTLEKRNICLDIIVACEIFSWSKMIILGEVQHVAASSSCAADRKGDNTSMIGLRWLVMSCSQKASSGEPHGNLGEGTAEDRSLDSLLARYLYISMGCEVLFLLEIWRRFCGGAVLAYVNNESVV